MAMNIIRSAKTIRRFLCDTLPLVNSEIDRWQTFAAEKICDDELKTQALASIRDKRFHCLGGSFYSVYPATDKNKYVIFIVALQTISDYLDNLCDRTSTLDEKAFAQLHLALTDSLMPSAPPTDYYAYYPYKNDGGYLRHLVVTCQSILRTLPSYPLIKKDLATLGILYSRLQTYKHITPGKREQAMLDWIQKTNTNSALMPWEFAAATGSTLGIFMLCTAGQSPDLTKEDVQMIMSSYFPWICALHIQLDYFIDQAEDLEHNDLNFIFYYKNDDEVTRRLIFIYDNAFSQACKLPNAFFSQTIVRGLTALYLSDEKVKTIAQQNSRAALLNHAGYFTRLIYHLCRILRKKNIL